MIEKIQLPMHVFDVIDSTNDYCLKNNEILANRSFVMAYRQTKGRGQYDRKWQSQENKNLLCSILLKDKGESDQSLLPSLTSLALIHLLDHHDIKASVKWPNDVLVDGKKVAGILIESVWESSKRTTVIGVGLNINQTIFPNELRSIATSMCLVAKREFMIEEIASEWIEQFNHLSELSPQLLLAEYKRKLIGLNQPVVVIENNHHLHGIFVDIDSAGHLIIDCDGRRVTCLSRTMLIEQPDIL